jgi:oxygen-independent coproporphyrinogen-3 oxidase
MADRAEVTSIYFGGGTPALMSPALVGAVIDTVARELGLTPDAEITLEANPTSAEAERFAAFRAAGVNRLSLGIQALDDAALVFLGRNHDVAQARAAWTHARRNFPRATFDLIYARPGQSLGAWQRELAQALPLAQAAGHLSLYQLSFEEGTPFGRAAAAGEIVPLDADRQADFYAAAQDACAAADLPAYEVSNHAAAGRESRHNLVYWRYRPYVGVGPGAHGRVFRNGRRRATEEIRDPAAWLAAAEDSGMTAAVDRLLPVREEVEELLFMGLRLTEGVAAARFEQVAGRPLADVIQSDRCRAMIEGGLIVLDSNGLRLTARGRPILNSIYGALVERLSW